MEKLQCEICGGALMMDGDGESAVCESCGMRFKKETIKKMVMELSGPIKIDGPVQVEGMENASTLATRAADFEKLGMLDSAKMTYRKMTEKFPGDYRGWWGVAHTSETNLQPELLEKALKLAPAEIQAEIQKDICACGTRQAVEMADRAFDTYHAQVQAIYEAEDGLAEKMADAKARLAGAKQRLKNETTSVAVARILFFCFALATVLCYMTGQYLLVLMGVVVTFVAFICSFSAKGMINRIKEELAKLEKQPEDYSAKIAAIPVPDGSGSSDSAAFKKHFDSLLQEQAENREKQLAELQKSYEHMMKMETLGREIAAYCNKKPLKKVCQALQIKHLMYNNETDFVVNRSHSNKRFKKFDQIYGHSVKFEAEYYGAGKNHNDWASVGILSASCEVFADEHYRNMLS